MTSKPENKSLGMPSTSRTVASEVGSFIARLNAAEAENLGVVPPSSEGLTVTSAASTQHQGEVSNVASQVVVNTNVNNVDRLPVITLEKPAEAPVGRGATALVVEHQRTDNKEEATGKESNVQRGSEPQKQNPSSGSKVPQKGVKSKAQVGGSNSNRRGGKTQNTAKPKGKPRNAGVQPPKGNGVLADGRKCCFVCQSPNHLSRDCKSPQKSKRGPRKTTNQSGQGTTPSQSTSGSSNSNSGSAPDANSSKDDGQSSSAPDDGGEDDLPKKSELGQKLDKNDASLHDVEERIDHQWIAPFLDRREYHIKIDEKSTFVPIQVFPWFLNFRKHLGRVAKTTERTGVCTIVLAPLIYFGGLSEPSEEVFSLPQPVELQGLHRLGEVGIDLIYRPISPPPNETVFSVIPKYAVRIGNAFASSSIGRFFRKACDRIRSIRDLTSGILWALSSVALAWCAVKIIHHVSRFLSLGEETSNVYSRFRFHEMGETKYHFDVRPDCLALSDILHADPILIRVKRSNFVLSWQPNHFGVDYIKNLFFPALSNEIREDGSIDDMIPRCHCVLFGEVCTCDRMWRRRRHKLTSDKKEFLISGEFLNQLVAGVGVVRDKTYKEVRDRVELLAKRITTINVQRSQILTVPLIANTVEMATVIIFDRASKVRDNFGVPQTELNFS